MIDIDTDKDIPYMRGDFLGEVPVPNHICGRLSLNEPTGSAVVIKLRNLGCMYDSCMCVQTNILRMCICSSVSVCVCLSSYRQNCLNGISYAVMCWEFFCCFLSVFMLKFI